MRVRPARARLPLARLILTTLVLVIPAAAGAGGIVFLPGVQRDGVVRAAPSLALLTWELPDGLLVVDRAGPPDRTRFGPAFAASFADADWFLVRDRSPRHADVSAAALGRFGATRPVGAAAWVVEVPRERLDRFLAAGFSLQRLPLGPPPPDARAERDAAAPLAIAEVDTALKRAYINTLSQAAFNQVIQEISGYTTFLFAGQPQQVHTRYYSTAAKNLVGGYLAGKLAAYGYTVQLDTFMVGSVTCRNVIATRIGLGAPAEYVVVGGHYDSTAPLVDAPTTAPGAEDNASGTSLVMELARISAHRGFDRSIQFVLFDSEEQGLNGSEHFVADATAQGRQIEGAIIADMVAWYQGTYGLHIEGETAWESLMQSMAANVTAYTPCVYVKDYYSWGSDHVPFQQAGIPAFLAIDYDYEEYPHYHQTSDTWPRIQGTAALGLQISRAAAATLADLAGLRPDLTGAPPTPDAPPRLAAWPNPFNPRLTVAFNLAAAAPGEIALYDLAGRRVRTLASGELPAGEQRRTWDGRDDRGRLLPSGVYLCRLRTATETANLKVNLAR
ncbi:MAG: M28 family metallopeptidase [Candidatus Krumholzibacteriia bacterium]